MKAAVLRQAGQPLQIEDVEVAKPGPREVLIRTAAAGVCHSDLHFVEGAFAHPLPTVLGHESAGVVEAVGEEVRTVRPGDHVVTCLSVYCGHCEFCRSERLNLCVSPETRRRKDEPPRLSQGGAPVPQFLNLSGFAEQMLVHEHACTVIPKDMPLDRAALLGCAVITGYGAVTRGSRVAAGESVAVIGLGGVGLAAINAAAIAGAGRIVGIDRNPAKAELAAAFGATDFLAADEPDLVRRVVELTAGGVHHSFEAVGQSETAEQAFGMLRRGGTANLLGMLPVGQSIRLPGAAFMGERRFQGSLMGSNNFPVDIPKLVELYLKGRLHLDQMISRRIRLADINVAFAEMKQGGIARSVIVFDS
jgi:S-(hydroxymethyl)glutathione dehydrogenase / alcohol dehydrogenase